MVQAAWPRGLDPDRLSFTHAVRVIKRKMPQAAAVPPGRLTAWRDALLDVFNRMALGLTLISLSHGRSLCQEKLNTI